MLDILYNVIITPLIYVISFAYSILYRMLGDPGLAIIGMSLFVNVLCLPLYQMADAAQQAERDKQQAMSHWVDHIKKHFSGDEQYMMLSTYYRQQNYHPLQALSGTFTLLLQIPFFIAAYHYLSGLELLNETPFLFLPNLGEPDQLISLGGFTINVMPIVMTLMNVASTYFYTKGLPLRDKLQTYGLALVFLFLLYDSPSGLVFYWTCNQVFSLFKNIITKSGHARLIVTVLLEAFVAGVVLYLMRIDFLITPKRKLVLALGVGILQLLIFGSALAAFIRSRRSAKGGSKRLAQDERPATALFVLSSLLVATVVGLLIPSALVGASPGDFMSVADFVNPLKYIVHTCAVSLGLFCLWVGVFYYLGDAPLKRKIAVGMTLVAGIILVNYFTYGKDFGVITEGLKYEEEIAFPIEGQLKNLMYHIPVVLGILLVYKLRPQLLNSLLVILLISVIGVSVPNLRTIKKEADATEAEAIAAAADSEAAGLAPVDDEGNALPIYKLSKTGRNVVVLFLDRAMGIYVPYTFQEKPELQDKFDGFTFYPNTISHGYFTIFGAAGIYGGYEYIPQVTNQRTDKTIPEKNNEGISVLPTIFANAGYTSTIIDPPYGKYDGRDLVSPLFEADTDEDSVNYYYTYDRYTTPLFAEQEEITEANQERNFMFYSLFKAAPAWLQPMVYDDGLYHSTLVNHTHTYKFERAYTELLNLENMTEIDDGESYNFVALRNRTTHDPEELQLPDYTPSLYLHNEGLFDPSQYVIDGKELHMENELQITHYQANMATFMRLAEWFDWMRENDVYDNTRIIIVSDHGRFLRQYDDLNVDKALDVQGINSVLMVKDFYAHGYETDNTFMTVADTPTIALSGLVSNPTNPFTGNAINSDFKYEHDQEVTVSYNWEPEHHTDVAYDCGDGAWYALRGDNIFDKSSWDRFVEPTKKLKK